MPLISQIGSLPWRLTTTTTTGKAATTSAELLHSLLASVGVTGCLLTLWHACHSLVWDLLDFLH